MKSYRFFHLLCAIGMSLALTLPWAGQAGFDPLSFDHRMFGSPYAEIASIMLVCGTSATVITTPISLILLGGIDDVEVYFNTFGSVLVLAATSLLFIMAANSYLIRSGMMIAFASSVTAIGVSGMGVEEMNQGGKNETSD